MIHSTFDGRQFERGAVRTYAGGIFYRYCQQCGSVWKTENNLKSDHNAANPDAPVMHGRSVCACLTCGAEF